MIKKIWKKYSKWDKIGIYFFAVTLIIMVLALLLIGTVVITFPSKKSLNGFSILTLNDEICIQKEIYFCTIGDFIKGSSTNNKGISISLSKIFNELKNYGATITGSAGQLQTGVILAVIFTPILLFGSISICGYSYYLKKINK